MLYGWYRVSCFTGFWWKWRKNINIYSSILNNKLSVNKGMLYENVIAQMLVANGNKLYFYNHYNEYKKRNDIEINFLLNSGNKAGGKIIPIEVKSAIKYKNISLDRFIEKYKNRIKKHTSFILKIFMLKKTKLFVFQYIWHFVYKKR